MARRRRGRIHLRRRDPGRRRPRDGALNRQQPTALGTSAPLPLPLLRIIGFISFFDRFATAPMLIVLAKSVGITLEQAIQLTTVYAILYGAGQPVWGVISDRVGRVAVLRIALAGAILGSVVSVLATGYVPLLLARAVTGFTVGALYPMLLTILGDSLEGHARFTELSNLQTVSALGNAAATLVAGTLAALIDWRAVFGITILTSVAAWIALEIRRRPEAARVRGRSRDAFRGWPLVVYTVALLEGFVLLGILTYIVPAMEFSGVPVALAGLLASTYALGIVVGSRIVNPLARRTGRIGILLIGGTLLVTAYTTAALASGPVALTVTALLVGLSNALFHSTIQGWMTSVAPGARATTVSIFATSLFLGAGIATGVSADLAGRGEFRLIFAVTAGCSVALVAFATLAYRRWLREAAPQGNPPV